MKNKIIIAVAIIIILITGYFFVTTPKFDVDKTSGSNEIYVYGENVYVQYDFLEGNLSLNDSKKEEVLVDIDEAHIGQGFNYAKLENGKYELIMDDESIPYEGDLTAYGYTRDELSKRVRIIGDGSKTLMEISEVENKPTYDIVLDPGHGGVEPGAAGVGSYESPVMLEFALLLQEKLEAKGFKVALTRTEDVGEFIGDCSTGIGPGRIERYQWAYQYQAPMYMSLHFDVGPLDTSYPIMSANAYESDEFGPIYIKHMTDTQVFTDEVYATKITIAENGFCGKPVTPENEWKDWYYSVRDFGGVHTGSTLEYDDGKLVADDHYGSVAFLVEAFNGSLHTREWFDNNLDTITSALADAIEEFIYEY